MKKKERERKRKKGLEFATENVLGVNIEKGENMILAHKRRSTIKKPPRATPATVLNI